MGPFFISTTACITERVQTFSVQILAWIPAAHENCLVIVYLPFFKLLPGLSGWHGVKKWGVNILKWNTGLIFWAISCLNCKPTSLFRYAAHGEVDLQRGLTTKPTWGAGGGRGVHERNQPAAAVSFPRLTGSLFSHQWSELTGQLRES